MNPVFNDPLPVIIFVIVFFAVIIVLFKVSGKANDKRGEKIRSVGDALGAQYWKGQSQERYPDSLLMGRVQATVQHALSRDDGVDTGEASFSRQAGNKKVMIQYHFERAMLPSSSGVHLLIDIRQKNFVAEPVLLYVNYHSEQKFEEFTVENAALSQNYQLYGVVGSEQQVFQIFDVDFITQLVSAFSDRRIEIVDDQVYLYGPIRQEFIDTEWTKRQFEEGDRLRRIIAVHINGDKNI